MNIQRLRNLTTGILHTDIACVYEDIEHLIGETGIFTHMIPDAMRALRPWLRARVAEPAAWVVCLEDDSRAEIALEPMNETERADFWRAFAQQETMR